MCVCVCFCSGKALFCSLMLESWPVECVALYSGSGEQRGRAVKPICSLALGELGRRGAGGDNLGGLRSAPPHPPNLSPTTWLSVCRSVWQQAGCPSDCLFLRHLGALVFFSQKSFSLYEHFVRFKRT